MEPTAQIIGYKAETVGALAKVMTTAASKVWNVVYHLAEVSRQRRQLRNLDSRLLDDIGIDRAEALKEANRPAWDI